MTEMTIAAIAPRPSPRPSLLVFDIAGKIGKADIEGMAEMVDAAFDDYDKIDMLLIFSHFEGMDASAVVDREALGVQFRAVGHVRKYGVVGAPTLARAMIEIGGALSPVEAKSFDRADEPEAWAWIEEGTDSRR